MAGFLVDLHCHTAERSYDGEVPAREVVQRLVELGFQGVVFTDHNHVWPTGELDALRRDLGLAEDFLLLSGQEVRAAIDGLTFGDLLVYGPQEDIPDGAHPSELLRRAREAGGFCIAAHVGAVHVGCGERVGDFPIDGAEVWNGRYGSRVAALSNRVVEELAVARTGGSDTHRTEDIGGGGTVLDGPARTLPDLARMIRGGACEPYVPTRRGRLARWLKRGR